MHILVLQHAWVEAPGVLDDALDGDAHPRTHVHLDEGESSPPLDDFDALWVLGGPMDITDEESHPWLRREKRVIREAVQKRSLAFLGICLGHQLLAEALGGRCVKADPPEQGVYPLELTDAGVRTGLFEGFGSPSARPTRAFAGEGGIPARCWRLARQWTVGGRGNDKAAGNVSIRSRVRPVAS